MSCITIFYDMIKVVNKVNTDLVINTMDNTEYKNMCIQPNLSFEAYHTEIKTEWELLMNDHTSNQNCLLNDLFSTYEKATNNNKKPASGHAMIFLKWEILI